MRRPLHPGKHYSERTLRIHSFILSFSLSALLLAIVLSATLVSDGFWELKRSLSAGDEILPVAGNASDIPITVLTEATKEDGLTVLVMGVKDTESISNTYLLLRFDPLRSRIPVTSLPPQTLVVKPQGDQTPLTLTEVYRFGGHTLTVQAMENTFGFPIDRYVVVEAEAFVELGSLAGPVQYLLGQTLEYADSERVIRLSKGLQLVDGQKALDIITYPAYPGGDSIRAEITASLAVQIINHKLSLAASAGAEELFKAVVNRVETDITYLDFEERRNLAAKMEHLSPAFQIYPEGEYSADGKTYLLSESAVRMLGAYFGR